MAQNQLTLAETGKNFAMSFRGIASREGSRPRTNSSSNDSEADKPGYMRAISKHDSRKMNKKRDGSSDGGYNSAYMLV